MKDMTAQPIPTVLCCSPRKSGNSDQAGALIAQGFQASGRPIQTLFVRDYQVLSCLGCGQCRTHPQRRCFQEDKDQSRGLFQVLLTSPMIFICSPIFFYHVPAQFKALIDRSQAYYLAQEDRQPWIAKISQRAAHVCLVAGRPQGEKLFDGSLLTLKYFLKVFGLSLGQTILVRGKDEPEALAKDLDLCRELESLGRTLAKEFQVEK